MQHRCCPFCGGDKLKVDSKVSNQINIINGNRYKTYTASVRCNKCHSRGPTVSGQVLCGSQQHMFEIQKMLEIEAYKQWNIRIQGENI